MKKINLLLLSLIVFLPPFSYAGDLSPRLEVIQVSKYGVSGKTEIHASSDIDGCYWLQIPENDDFMLSMALSAYATGYPVRIQLKSDSCEISRFVNEK